MEVWALCAALIYLLLFALEIRCLRREIAKLRAELHDKIHWGRVDRMRDSIHRIKETLDANGIY